MMYEITNVCDLYSYGFYIKFVLSSGSQSGGWEGSRLHFRRGFISGGAVYRHLESGTQCDHLGIGSCCNPYFPGSMSLLNTMGHISG